MGPRVLINGIWYKAASVGGLCAANAGRFEFSVAKANPATCKYKSSPRDGKMDCGSRVIILGRTVNATVSSLDFSAPKNTKLTPLYSEQGKGKRYQTSALSTEKMD